ncbi:hypothetical protein ABZY14_26905 [Streptomyces sp. NPDC006617]
MKKAKSYLVAAFLVIAAAAGAVTAAHGPAPADAVVAGGDTGWG